MAIDVISTLLREFDDPAQYTGALLVGSMARGQPSRFSDIDLVFVATEEPKDKHDKYRLVYRHERLISLSVKTLASARDAFSDPAEAVNSIQGLRDCVILRDSANSELSKLKADALQFEWTASLKAAALEEASYLMMGNAEEVHKVLRGFVEDDPSSMLNGAWGLTLTMPMVMALKHNVLSAGDNLFRNQVCEAVGRESNWTKLHGIATGVRPGPLNLSNLAQQGAGAVRLYEETARLLAESLRPADAEVVEGAISTALSCEVLARMSID
jgi:predicted nucleotidyltransferase